MHIATLPVIFALCLPTLYMKRITEYFALHQPLKNVGAQDIHLFRLADVGRVDRPAAQGISGSDKTSRTEPGRASSRQPTVSTVMSSATRVPTPGELLPVSVELAQAIVTAFNESSFLRKRSPIPNYNSKGFTGDVGVEIRHTARNSRLEILPFEGEVDVIRTRRGKSTAYQIRSERLRAILATESE